MMTCRTIATDCTETALSAVTPEERLAARCSARRGVRVRTFGTLRITRTEARDASGETPGYGPSAR
jgi:hypothetical protein